ncbi:MAG TPA: DUF4388 domain-containing protein [Planctomycetes bacterium]|nr:DUF4388 domain-containing protein [Planctomycetota bacterium]
MSTSSDTQRVYGDLKNFSIFDITHTLMMSRKTALVSIQRGTKKGYVYFQDGQIINALDDDLSTGEKAAFKIFFWRSGSFTIDFDVEVPERNVKLDTENLLLEVARNMDEQQRDNVGRSDEEGGDAAAEQFDDRFRVELNKIFEKVATDTTPARDRYSVAAFDELLMALNDLDGSALFLRLGCKPRIKTAQGFTTIKQEPIAEGEIEGYLNSLFSESESEEFRARKETSTFYSSKEAGMFEVRAFLDQGRPSCIFRPASRSVPPLAQFGEAATELDGLLCEKKGLVILTGPYGGGKTELLAALLERGLRDHDQLVALFSRTQTYAFTEECGFMLRAPLNRFTMAREGSLRTAIEHGADVIAVDAVEDAAMLETAVRAANHGILVLITLELDAAPDLADRLRDLQARPGGERAVKDFSRSLIDVVHIELPTLRRLRPDDDLRDDLARGRFQRLHSA